MFVITGPSGVGKGTLIRRLRAAVPELAVSVSATTRAPREGEVDGVDYRFLDEQEFLRRVGHGAFVEHAEYAGRHYGTLREELDRHTSEGRPVVLEIEFEGARQVRAAMPEATQVFIAPPTFEELGDRLRRRGTDDESVIARRLEVGRRELAAYEPIIRDEGESTHRIVNDDLDRAADELTALVRASLASSPAPSRR